jgi:hypothetical protein
LYWDEKVGRAFDGDETVDLSGFPMLEYLDRAVAACDAELRASGD